MPNRLYAKQCTALSQPCDNPCRVVLSYGVAKPPALTRETRYLHFQPKYGIRALLNSVKPRGYNARLSLHNKRG